MVSGGDLGPISPLVTERLQGGGSGKGAAVGDEATDRGDPAVLEGASRSRGRRTVLTPVPATGSMEKGPVARRALRWFSRRSAEAQRGRQLGSTRNAGPSGSDEDRDLADKGLGPGDAS